jgi:GxxExxY protein
LEDLNELTEKITGCGIEVQRHLGPGPLEATCQEALWIECADWGLRYWRQVPSPILYKGNVLGGLNLLMEDAVMVEVKSVERMDPNFPAQILTYLKATGEKAGLFVNFHTCLMHEGIKRFVL